MTTTITTPHRGQAAPGTQSQQTEAAQHYLFTLKFLPEGKIAVLEVRGAINVQEARAIACEVLPQCKYEVLDGDQSNGTAEIFYSWSNAAAQERYPKPRRCWSATIAEQEARYGNL